MGAGGQLRALYRRGYFVGKLISNAGLQRGISGWAVRMFPPLHNRGESACEAVPYVYPCLT